MSLFSPSPRKSDTNALTASHPAPAPGTVMGRKVPVLDFLYQLKKGETIHFVTEGKWSSHEMLARLLEITGAASVRISTYSMTEDPARMLVNYLHTGQISDLKVITDKRFQGQQGAAHQLAIANFPVVLSDVHAKVMVIRNADWNVVVLGSANFTRNKRTESGVVIENRTAAEFHWNWIDGKAS